MLTVVAVGYGVLLAQAVPSWTELSQLGVVALALIVGAAGATWVLNKMVLKPAEKRATDERTERIKAQEEWKEAFQLTLPALTQANTNSATFLEWLRRGEGQK